MGVLFRLRTLSFDEWLLAEIGKARARIAELEHNYPAAPVQELAQRLIDDKKQLAATGGAVAGLFGLAAIPADLALLAYLELTLGVELALVHGVNLKSTHGKRELFDVIGFNGELGPVYLALPRLASRATVAIFRRLGWRTIGRAVPVLSAPLSAFVNNRAIQKVGDRARLRFAKFPRGKRKSTEPLP